MCIRDRCQLIWASLIHVWEDKDGIGFLCKVRCFYPANRNDGMVLLFGIISDNIDLCTFTRMGEGKNNGSFRDHSQITMGGLRRVKEKGWRARRGQAGGDFTAYMTRFPNPHDNDMSLGREDCLNGRHKAVSRDADRLLRASASAEITCFAVSNMLVFDDMIA